MGPKGTEMEPKRYQHGAPVFEKTMKNIRICNVFWKITCLVLRSRFGFRFAFARLSTHAFRFFCQSRFNRRRLTPIHRRPSFEIKHLKPIQRFCGDKMDARWFKMVPRGPFGRLRRSIWLMGRCLGPLVEHFGGLGETFGLLAGTWGSILGALGTKPEALVGHLGSFGSLWLDFGGFGGRSGSLGGPFGLILRALGVIFRAFGPTF